MPHQCLKCDTVYDNSSDSIIKGCSNCGGKLFLYVKQLPKEKKEVEISKEKKDIIIKELENYVDIENSDSPIILKLENVRILAPGKYEIDVNQLMRKEKPLIYRVQEGTYVIDLNYITGAVKNG